MSWTDWRFRQAGLSDWDPLSQEVLFDTLVIRYGWVLALALIIVVAGRWCRQMPIASRWRHSSWRRFGDDSVADRRWHHLPILCWALVSARNHLDLFGSLTYCQGPSVEWYWIVAYQSMLGLCAVCAVQVVGLTVAGESAHSLGATGYHRAAMTCALLAVAADTFFYLWAVTPFRGGGF